MRSRLLPVKYKGRTVETVKLSLGTATGTVRIELPEAAKRTGVLILRSEDIRRALHELSTT